MSFAFFLRLDISLRFLRLFSIISSKCLIQEVALVWALDFLDLLNISWFSSGMFSVELPTVPVWAYVGVRISVVLACSENSYIVVVRNLLLRLFKMRFLVDSGLTESSYTKSGVSERLAIDRSCAVFGKRRSIIS